MRLHTGYPRARLATAVCAVLLICVGCAGFGQRQAPAPIYEVEKISAIVYGKGLTSDSKDFSKIRSYAYWQNRETGDSLPYKIGKKDMLADAYLPVDCSVPNKPAIIFIDGDSFQEDARTKHNTPPYGNFFASRGIAFFSIDHRLIADATPEGESTAERMDLKSAIRWLRANCETFGVDPNRIAVMGDSYGGRICVDVGISKADRYISDLPENHIDQSSRPDAVINLWGPLSVPDFDPSDPPFLLIFGSEDRLFNWGEMIADQCERNGIPCVFHVLEGEGHSPMDAKLNGKSINDLILDIVNEY